MGSASLPELGFIPKTPLPGQRRRSVSDAVLAVSLTECFFTTHTPCRQSWRGHRIAPLNPGVGTGLPHSILARAQDCPTQSWRGHRIAPVFPRKRWKRSAVQHYAPRLAARIARKTPAVRRYTPVHSRTRRPASRLQIWQVTQRKWGRSSCFLRQNTAANSPRTPWCHWFRARAFSSGRQNRAKPWL